MSLLFTCGTSSVTYDDAFKDTLTVYEMLDLLGKRKEYALFTEDFRRVFPQKPFKNKNEWTLFVPMTSSHLPDTVVKYHVPVEGREPLFIPLATITNGEHTINTVAGAHLQFSNEAVGGRVQTVLRSTTSNGTDRVVVQEAHAAKDGIIYTIDKPIVPASIQL
jgi:hypothetical protein